MEQTKVLIKSGRMWRNLQGDEVSLSYMRSCLKFQTEQKQTGFRVQDSPSFLFSREARAPQCVDMYKDLAKHPVAPEGLGLLCLPPS